MKRNEIKTVADDRNGCALHGALRLVDAIEGVVPILHASSGCGLAAGFGDKAGSGHDDALDPGSTRLLERHVVYGGTSRLREQIRNSLKVLKGDAYVVLTGCVPEVVGDDAPAMAKEAREQRNAVIDISTPGFKGNGYFGYERALTELAGQLPELLTLAAQSGPAEPGAINLLGVAPGLDAFWEGDLLELEAQISRLGFPVNRLVGVGQSSAEWRVLPQAGLNVVLSPWGLAAAKRLQERHGTPFVDFGWLPVGSKDLGALIEQIGTLLEVDAGRISAIRQTLDRNLRYFLQKLMPTYLKHDLQKRVAIVGSSAYAIGIARFLAGTFGQSLATVIITDRPDEIYHQRIIDAIRGIDPAADVAISFADSSLEIDEHLLAAQPEIILGSGIESRSANELGIPLVETTAPVRSGPVLARRFAGVIGAVALVEEFGTAVIRHHHQTELVTPAVHAEPLGTHGYASVPLTSAEISTSR